MPAFRLPSTPAVLAIACVALLAGCDSRDAARDPAARADAPATNAATDGSITAGVKATLARDVQLGLLDIEVHTRRGQVLLRGAAPDTDARRRATQLARGVAGVADVRNDLSVQVQWTAACGTEPACPRSTVARTP